jgi:hypothetical protein
MTKLLNEFHIMNLESTSVGYEREFTLLIETIKLVSSLPTGDKKAMEGHLIERSYDGIVALGQLEHAIDKYCEFESLTELNWRLMKDQWKMKIHGDKDKLKDEAVIRASSKQCLSVVKVFAMFSTTRQAMLMVLAGISPQTTTTATTPSSKAIDEGLAKMMLKQLYEEQKRDKRTLKFLVDPLHNYMRRAYVNY